MLNWHYLCCPKPDFLNIYVHLYLWQMFCDTFKMLAAFYVPGYWYSLWSRIQNFTFSGLELDIYSFLYLPTELQFWYHICIYYILYTVYMLGIEFLCLVDRSMWYILHGVRFNSFFVGANIYFFEYKTWTMMKLDLKFFIHYRLGNFLVLITIFLYLVYDWWIGLYLVAMLIYMFRVHVHVELIDFSTSQILNWTTYRTLGWVYLLCSFTLILKLYVGIDNRMFW